MGAVLPQRLVERGAPIRLAEADDGGLDLASRRFVEAQRARGVGVILPLATHGKLLGLLAVGRKRSEEELSREDLDHLLTIANQGALGLEAAGLHEELTRRAEVERDLDIARDIQTSLFPRELPARRRASSSSASAARRGSSAATSTTSSTWTAARTGASPSSSATSRASRSRPRS